MPLTFMGLFIVDTSGQAKVSFTTPSFQINLNLFILGMAKVVSKYLEGIYGLCPRALCSS